MRMKDIIIGEEYAHGGVRVEVIEKELTNGYGRREWVKVKYNEDTWSYKKGDERLIRSTHFTVTWADYFAKREIQRLEREAEDAKWEALNKRGEEYAKVIGVDEIECDFEWVDCDDDEEAAVFELRLSEQEMRSLLERLGHKVEEEPEESSALADILGLDS